MLAQAELLVIDEAAAIPLPLVRNMLGSYLVFISSTVNGYEGTGRSLSLKLLDSLRKQSATNGLEVGGRTLNELTLDESIRYAPNCPVESWLNRLLCLDKGVNQQKGGRLIAGAKGGTTVQLQLVQLHICLLRSIFFSAAQISDSSQGRC